MKKLLTLCLLILSGTVWAEKSTPHYGQLGNGLRYALLPLHDEKGHMEIRLRVNAGAVDEADNQAGVAHMLEHLVFRATEKYPQGIMTHLHADGWVRARHYNAVTTVDNTTYMLTPPKGKGLAQSLEALAQMLFHAKLSQQDLDLERQIIREEWRAGQGVANRMNRQRTEALRDGSRYARFPVIGTQESINTMPATQLQDFYQKWYAPNNMQLLIVGDIRISEAETLIKQHFGQPKRRTLPTRDYLDPPLAEGLTIKQLQDAQSGVSQVAYVLRFDNRQSRAQTERGRYERLLDRLALALITQRLRNQAQQLPDGVKSVVVRRADIGRNHVALGFFSSVSATAQREGLTQIFTELERLKRYPISHTELAAQKAKIQAQIDNAKQHQGDRDFSGWVKVMVESFLVDQPYLSQPEIARRTEPMLHKISLTEINRRIADWLAVTDRVITYQAPRLTEIAPISVEFAENLQKQTASRAISPPQQAKVIEPMSLTALDKAGEILEVQRFASHNVQRWRLSNGDTLVWLKSPLAKDRSYFQAVSPAGFNSPELNPWQSQLAVQMIAQNAPLDWEIEQLKQWKTIERVNLSLKQSAATLSFDGSAENEKLGALFRLFYAYQQETRVKAGLDEVKEEMSRSLTATRDDDEQRVQAVGLLRFGAALPTHRPTSAALNALSAQDLDSEWQKMVRSPMTYYVFNDLDESEMRKLVAQHLAAIPRGNALAARHLTAREGRAITKIAQNIEPRDDVKMWFFTPHTWRGEDAVMVALLRQIAANKLKLALRDQALGVYSLRFDSQLNRDTARIESELSFVANPTLTDKLIALSEEVLANLADHIEPADIQAAKSQFALAEKSRLALPQTWLQRLIISFEQYGNPDYLGEMQQLGEGINLTNAKAIAAKLYSRENVKIFIVTPKQVNNLKESQ